MVIFLKTRGDGNFLLSLARYCVFLPIAAEEFHIGHRGFNNDMVSDELELR